MPMVAHKSALLKKALGLITSYKAVIFESYFKELFNEKIYYDLTLLIFLYRSEKFGETIHVISFRDRFTHGQRNVQHSTVYQVKVPSLSTVSGKVIFQNTNLNEKIRG